MSRILFVMKYPIVDPYSLKNKFNGQIKASMELGHDVYYLGYDHNNFYLINDREKEIVKKIWFGNNKRYIHTKAFYDLFDAVNIVLDKYNFDIAYIRRMPLSVIAIKTFQKLNNSGCKIIVEVPTYPPTKETERRLLRRVYSKYSSICWRAVLKYITLYALIGEKADTYNSIPAINIENGIDVDSVPIRHPSYDSRKIHFLAVASMSKWHGYDRLINSIAKLDNEKKDMIIFDMVGDEGDGSLIQWKELVDKLELQKQVLFHGKRIGEELDLFFNRADLGICSLGMYRNGFSEGSILKLREYTARGLPFVYAAIDPAISEEQTFCMKVSNDDSFIDVDCLICFALNARNDKTIATSMREYAQNRMSWKRQMSIVYSRLNELK